jgi:hypothetical protein
MPEPTFRFANGELRMEPSHVAVTVPDTWVAANDPPPPNMSVLLRNKEGATLIAAAATRMPGSGAEATLRDVLEDKKKQYGTVDDANFSQETVARFFAPTLAFTVHTNTGAVRTKVWMIGNKAYWMSFQCGARVDAFASAEAACKTIIDSFRVVQPE